jgi:outer membrane protein insertion porin family
MKHSLALLLAAAPALARAEPTAAIVDGATDAAVHESEPEPAPAPAPLPRAPTGRFQIGAGYNPDDGFVASATVAQDDLFRTGQHLSVSADVSAIRQRFILAHAVPDLLGTGLDLRTELFSSRRQYPGFSREGTGGAVTLGNRVAPATRVYARYRVEHVGIDLAAASRMTAASANLGEGLLATLGAGIEYDTLDSPLLPRRGTRLELFGERADRRLGSAHELWRAGAVVEHARPIGPLTLRLHGHATYVRSRDPMGVPLAFRLQHEGHAMVRGYALDTANPLGDNAEAVGRAELELPLIPKLGISLAGFADAGLRYTADSAWGPRGALLQRSVGVSLIWRSPIGPLRFDWAFPLDGADRDRQFLFGLGGAL